MRVESVVSRVRELAAVRELVLVGVDGLGGAGKTTLAGRVAAAVPGTTLVHGDDFYEPEERGWRSWTPEQGRSPVIVANQVVAR